MKSLIQLQPTLLLALVATSYAQADTNINTWYPEPDIPNIHMVELFTYNGLPHDTEERNLKILVNHAYAIGYSEEHKIPLYAVYRLGNTDGSAEQYDDRSFERHFERPKKFQIDLRTDARVHHEDYTSSGFDRGHIAPNFVLRRQYGHLAQLESFLMSNIAPQKPDLNRGIWQKAEKRIATKIAEDDQGPKSDDDITDHWVISGCIMGEAPDTVKDTGIAIPEAFYKIIVRRSSYYERSLKAVAVFYSHTPVNGEFEEKFVSVREIEEMTGLDFHSNLPDKLEKKLETTKYGWDWKKIN